jgi:hypothetical protein
MPIRPENRARWALRSVFVRTIRARNRCEWCGAANGVPHPVTGSKVVLTTALCQKCHNGHDAAARQQRRRARLEIESGQTTLTLA